MSISKKPTNPEKEEIKRTTDQDVLYYRDLVHIVRESKNRNKVNEAFEKIVESLETKMKKLARKFRIPGNTEEDTYQECLIALKTKAIKDYNELKGSDPTKPAPFDRFAIICIKRHLSTTFKASNGNKVRSLNESQSLDQSRSTENGEVSLVEIICSKDKDIATVIQDKEIFVILMKRLMKKLSPLEVVVLRLYAQQHTYEEIAKFIKKNNLSKVKINIKGVDNALSRIKTKAKVIFEKLTKECSARNVNSKTVDNALTRIKEKAKKVSEEFKKEEKKKKKKSM